MIRAVMLASILLAGPVSAAGVEPGARIRVTLVAREPQPVVGSVLELPESTIVLAAGPDSSRRAIPLAAIEKLR